MILLSGETDPSSRVTLYMSKVKRKSRKLQVSIYVVLIMKTVKKILNEIISVL
jgi:hypothetical protein